MQERHWFIADFLVGLASGLLDRAAHCSSTQVGDTNLTPAESMKLAASVQKIMNMKRDKTYCFFILFLVQTQVKPIFLGCPY